MTNTMEGVLTMTIYTVLEGEHNEVSLLFQALEMAPDGLESGRKNLFEKLRKELLSHAKAEERTVYDRVREKTSKDALITEARHEHETMEKTLNEIDALDINSDEWMGKIRELKSQVEHHVEEEEDEFFAEMERLFNDDEADAMAKAFHEEKNKLLKALDRG